MAKNIKELVQLTLDEIRETANNREIKGVSSGFKQIDEVTNGWQASNLIVIGARPGMGKWAFLISMVKNMAIDYKKTTAIFTLELPSTQLVKRMLSSETGISLRKITTGNIEPDEWQNLNEKCHNLSNAPIYIDDSSAMSFFEIIAKAFRLVSQYDVEIIMIDYLQLITLDENCSLNRDQEISMIFKNLKALAIELNIPIILFSQLPDSIDNRKDNKRPVLSDFYPTLNLKQYIDILSFIYRPEYYGIFVWDDRSKSTCEGQAELILISKQKGTTDNIRLKFTGFLSKFSDL